MHSKVKSKIYLHSFISFITSLEFFVLPLTTASLILLDEMASVKLFASALLIDTRWDLM